jgi:hypothetical protein
MSKSIAMLAFVVAGQFSLAHAADQGRLNASGSNDPDISKEVQSGTIKEDETPAFATTDSPKTLQTDGDQSSLFVADHSIGLHPSLTNDPIEFQRLLPQNQSLVHVDFSSVAGQTAPLFVESTVDERQYAVGVFGSGDGAQAVTSVNGLPATYWFGPQAEFTFVLANGSVQIVFPQDVDAASLIAADVIRADLVESPDTQEVKTFNISMLDRNGYMMGEDRLIPQERPMFVGILSNAPFRSIIISSTAETWMFSSLDYAADQEFPMLEGAEGNVVAGTAMVGEENLTSPNSCHTDASGNTDLYKSGTVISARGIQPICANSGD